MRKDATVSRRAVLAALLLAPAGCASTPARTPGSGSGAKLMWAVGGIDAADRGPAADIADRWNDRHPNGPTVVVQELPETADEQRQLLALELNAGLGNFDILDLDVIWTAEFAENGWLVDLEDLRAHLEQVSLRGPLQTAVWDGTLWAAPHATNAGLLYYRKDLVDQPPTTWQELKEVGRRKGTELGIAPFVADGAQYEGLVVQYLEYFWAAGGEMLDSDGEEVLFRPSDDDGDAPAVQAAEFMHEAFRTGLYAPGFDTMTLEDARDVFQSGQAVFMRSWPYAYKLMNGQDPASQVAGKVGIAPLPTFADAGPADSVSVLGGHNLAVSSLSDNIPAAKEFVRFVSTSREVQRGLAERHSMAPTLRATYADLAGDPLMALLADVVPAARPRPAIPGWATISEEVQQQIFAAYTGGPEAPRRAVEALEDYLVATVENG